MNKAGTWITRENYGQDKKPLNAFEDGFQFKLYDRDITDLARQEVLSVNKDNIKDYWWLFSKLHDSLDLHPYFVIKMKELAESFKGKLENIQ